MNEVSIIQHARDTRPQTVTVSQVAELIRGDSWPPGYQPLLLVQGTFEGGTRQQDITRLSGLAVAVFSLPDGSSMAELREEARDDPHTLLLFGSADMLAVVYPYELDTGYELHLQRQFYQKAVLYGTDYYEQLLGTGAVRRGKDAGKRCGLCHDPDAYHNPLAEPFLAWEIKEGCRRQSGKPRSREGLRERKPNYQEVNMSTDEIDRYLDRHIELRRNIITTRMEYRWKDECMPQDRPWENFDDTTLNTLWRRMSKEKPVNRNEIDWEVNSDYVGDYNPLTDYLDSLPPWDGDDYIRGLALGVTVAGGFEEWCRFVECLRKWLVAMVAGWLNPEVVNHEVLVLIGAQGIYKTTWMGHLLPPQLRRYFSTQAGIGHGDKDAELALSQYALISCEELDAMTAREMNQMKRAVTLAHVNVRPAYGRYAVHRPHIASFCGTGNNEKFLNDPTGTRRWLAFKVENIESPRSMPFDYAGIYAQAYYLYRNGFEYWFSGDETKAVDAGNSRFKVANLERQMVHYYYRRPSGADPGEFVSVAAAMQQMPGNIVQKLRKEAVDQAFIDLGFAPIVADGLPGYRAVRRMPEELNALGRQMATRAGSDQAEDEPF